MLQRVRGIAACDEPPQARPTRRHGIVGALVLALALAACRGRPGAPAGATHPSAVATTWHVATTGSDGAAGTHYAHWKTIQHAAERVTPGDRVIVHAGTYPGFRVGAAGTPTNPIAFLADGAVTIEGSATADRDAIHIEGASSVRVEGFTVIGVARARISALDCDHITVRNKPR